MNYYLRHFSTSVLGHLQGAQNRPPWRWPRTQDETCPNNN